MTEVTWYVVAAKPKREGHAAADLMSQGYAVFLPRHWVTKSTRRRTRTELQALFPGYLFVAVDPEERQSVHAINTADDVIGVLVFGGIPATIREEDHWHLRRYFDPDGVLPPNARSLKHLSKIIRTKIMPKLPTLNLHDVLARIKQVDDSGRYRLRTKSTGDVSDLSSAVPFGQQGEHENGGFPPFMGSQQPETCP